MRASVKRRLTSLFRFTNKKMAATSGGSPAAGGDPIIFGVLTVSDRASSGVYADEGGPAILGFFDEAVASELRFLYIYIYFFNLLPLSSPRGNARRTARHFLTLSPLSFPLRWTAIHRIIPDDRDTIEKELKSMADEEGCAVIVTTGGTGPAPRDVTPDATAAVCDRLMPGYGEQMRAISLRAVSTAVLSRQTAGVRGGTLILNLPGRPRAIRETIDEVWRSVPYCVDLIGGAYMVMDEGVVRAFRPAGAVRGAAEERRG